MSWNTAACFKSLCLAYTEYQQSSNDETVLELQRQIDALVGITSLVGMLKDFSPRILIYTESLSALVGIINEPNLRHTIYIKALIALSHLGNDIETKEILQTKFDLPSSLASLLLRMSSNRQLVLQGLSLLQKMSYGYKCHISTIYVTELLNLLSKYIQTSVSDQCLHSLQIMANLCRGNESVKNIVNVMDDVKRFYQALFKYLSHDKKSFSVASLSIITSLVLNDEMGEKIFNGNNLSNVIQLSFNVLITEEDLNARQYAADLIIDFLECPRILKALTLNDMFDTYISRVLTLLHSTDSYITIKILELLLALCQKLESRRNVGNVAIKLIQGEDETQVVTDQALSPMQALLHWVSVSDKDDVTKKVGILSLIFVKELIVIFRERGVLDATSAFINQLTPILYDNIVVDLSSSNEKHLKQKCTKLAHILEAVSILCKSDEFKLDIVQKIDIDHVWNIISNIYITFSEDIKAQRSPAFDCRYELVNLLFRTLEVVAVLKKDVPSGQERYTAVLQNDHILPFLCLGLSSTSKYLVHASLQVYAEGLKTKRFPAKCFGDIVLSHNIYKSNEAKKALQVSESSSSQHPPITSNVLRDITNKHSESPSIALLTEKLKKGLELKDSKISDIMEFYEHKLAAVAGRENNLQDLLEAKNVALSQSERLLSQYRCRQVQSEAECLKLRTMLSESERKGEVDSLKMNEFTKTKNELLEKINGLELIVNEHKELKNRFDEQTTHLETLQKAVKDAVDERQSLLSMNECLDKNIEKLSTKLDSANDRLQSAEQEKIILSNTIKDMEIDVRDLQKKLKESEVKTNIKQDEADSLLQRCKDLEKNVKSFEKSYKEAKNQISSLKTLCEHHEQMIKEKDEANNRLQAEMEKHNQIAAMIHNLTSGKMNVGS